MIKDLLDKLVQLNDSVRKDVTSKDVILAFSGGSCLKPHHLIVTTCSPYFNQVLAVCKKQTPAVLIPDVPVSVMEILLEFMYIGNVLVDKDLVELVEANKLIQITGLNDLLSKHMGSLPPKKKQRIEDDVSLPVSVKPSSLFRPWDFPVLVAPRPVHNLPWMHAIYGTAPLSNSMPSPMTGASGRNLSKTMPFPMSDKNKKKSDTAPSLLSSLMPWSMLYDKPFLSETAPFTSRRLNKKIHITQSAH